MVSEIPIDSAVVLALDELAQHGMTQAHLGNEIVISPAIFQRLTIPKRDRVKPGSRCVSLKQSLGDSSEIILAMDLLGATELRNILIFDKGNPLHWHTNSDVPGKRVYYVFNETSGSQFQYLDPTRNERITLNEPAGWSAKTFAIPHPDEAYLWHAVLAAGRRVSFGFLIDT